MASDNSIEILGQKFSYPDTWQGTAAILCVCICVAFLAYTLTPAQIDALAGVTRADDKKVEAKLTEINKKLLEENNYLKEQIAQVVENPEVDSDKLRELSSWIDDRHGNLNTDFEELVTVAEARVKNLNNTLDSVRSDQIHSVLSLEKQQMEEQLSTYENQRNKH